MANRPVYVSLNSFPYVRRIDVDFKFFSGFSSKQKKLSIESLHNAFRATHPGKSILEISSKSEIPLGISLSAFNLQIILQKSKRTFSVESAFQSSKVFKNGGPYKDILNKSSREAKKDERIRTSGEIIRFEFFGYDFPTEPKTYFYNWLYIHALNLHSDLKNEIMNYDCFTDIEFNPQKSLNCQAESAAIFVGLNKSGKLDEALKDEKTFLKIVYSDHKYRL